MKDELSEEESQTAEESQTVPAGGCKWNAKRGKGDWPHGLTAGRSRSKNRHQRQLSGNNLEDPNRCCDGRCSTR